MGQEEVRRSVHGAQGVAGVREQFGAIQKPLEVFLDGGFFTHLVSITLLE